MKKVFYLCFCFLFLAVYVIKPASAEITPDESSLLPTEIASDAEVITESASAPESLPEPKAFKNPWLDHEEVQLKEFLQQNWFFSKNFARRRNLGLAIAAAQSQNREFRRETELLLRNPGYAPIYSAYCIFPELLSTQISLSIEMLDESKKSLLKENSETTAVISKTYDTFQSDLQNLEIWLKVAEKISHTIERYQILNRRKTRVSRLHSLLKDQNSQTLITLWHQLRALSTLLSQHKLQLETAFEEIDFLKSRQNIDKVTVATRLARLKAILNDTAFNLKTYRRQLLEFTVKLKKQVKLHVQSLEELAGSNEKNIFHINDYLDSFPARDFSPESTDSFSMADNLAKAITSLDQKTGQAHDSSEFAALLADFDGLFISYSGFKELFNHHFQIEEAEESETVEKTDEIEEAAENQVSTTTIDISLNEI